MTDETYIESNRYAWKEYEQMIKDYDNSKFVSMERMIDYEFKMHYVISRFPNLASRIITLNGKLELPANSALHFLDNIGYAEDAAIDTPRLYEDFFFTHESFRKCIYHVREPDLKGVFTNSDKFIYRITGLPRNLTAFRSEYDIKPVLRLSDVPDQPTILLLINHNPLFRIKIMSGQLKYYRKIMLILTSVLNTVLKCYERTHREQYISIPWDTLVYERQDFLRSRTQLTISTIKHPNSWHYIFMMHLSNFLWSDSTTSIFKSLPQESLSHINFIIHLENHAIIYNLQLLVDFNKNNRAYLKVIRHLNMLSVLGNHDLTGDQKRTLYKKMEDDEILAKDETDPRLLKFTDNDVEYSVVDDIVSKVKDIGVNTVNTLTGIAIGNTRNFTATPMGVATTPVKSDMPKVTTTIENKKLKVETELNITKSKMENVDHTKDTATADYTATQDKLAVEFINKADHLTPAQKRRYEKLALKYKELKLGNSNLNTLLTKRTDNSIDVDLLDEEQLGIPFLDKGALRTSLASFDRDYMRKTFHKHMAGTLIAFQHAGVFLTDIKEDHVINELNDYTQYTVKYEDIYGKKSTLKFRMPTVNRDGNIKIDGIVKNMKKQRVNLPIVKISDTSVSLASNYNKTLVERNVTKAHSFSSYISDALIHLPHISVQYGSCKIEDIPVSYEYASLAQRYAALTFRSSNVEYKLWFNYPKREEAFDGKIEQLASLENQYGVYFGCNQAVWFFVDNSNRVTVVDKKTNQVVESDLSTITSVIAIADDEKHVLERKQLTEWVTIRLLDAKLPVIFLLAYREGLIKTLKYIGLDYTLTERGTKYIIDDLDDVIAERTTEATDGTEMYHEPFIPKSVTPEQITQVWGTLVKAWKDKYKITFPELNFKIDRTPRLENDAIDHDTPEDKWIAIWTEANLVYINKYASLVTYPDEPKLTKVKKLSYFWKKLYVAIGHAMCRDVLHRKLWQDSAIDKIYNQAYSTKFTTPYLNSIRDKSRLKIETICEFVATELVDTFWEDITEFNVGKVNDAGGRKKYVPKPNDISIKFNDAVLWFNRYPLAKSLIASGLDNYDLTDYSIHEFEYQDVYYRLMQDADKSINYLKGIDSFFDLFVDNMTYNVLRSMGEPTTVKDLLIRCAVLLSTLDHKDASSKANHRIRGYEQFNAVLYNEMSRQFASYQANRSNKNNSFSINPDAVYLRIISNASLVPSEAANPIQFVKEQSAMTYAGVGGRTAESFVINDRKFSKDDIGVISEATVDNSKVGLNAQLSWDPLIDNTEGMLGDEDISTMRPSRALSATSMLFPFSTCDIPNRTNFISIQSTHMTPTAAIGKMRVRTGYERTFAHRCSRDFAGIAEQNGKVIDIDERAHLVQVRYDDGTEDFFKYGEHYSPLQGFFVTQDIEAIVKVGQKVKKGDVITYNKGFFTLDPASKQLDMSIGVLANVAWLEMDSNLEDASEISKSLAEKMSIFPTQEQVISLNSDSLIHKMVEVGDTVEIGDPLLVFEEGVSGEDVTTADSFGVDEDTTALLSKLNRRIPKSKFSGKVVKIETYYGGNISDMHPTLGKIVRKLASDVNYASTLASNSSVAADFPPSQPIPSTVKYKGVQFDETTVMFIIYIREHEETTVGDKLVVSNQLKNTISTIMSHPTYAEEDGTEIDVLFSASAAARRITLSHIFNGLGNRVMEKLEQDILKIYFGDKANVKDNRSLKERVADVKSSQPKNK